MSFESDRHHLLAPTSLRPTPQSTRPPSIASVLSDADTIKPEIPVRSGRRPPILGDASASFAATQPRPYKGYPSEKAYLEALREWVEEKEYVQYEYSLIGFYGTKTAEDYKNLPSLRSSIKDNVEGRRATVTAAQGSSQATRDTNLSRQTSKDSRKEDTPRRSRTKSLGNLFTRRTAVA